MSFCTALPTSYDYYHKPLYAMVVGLVITFCSVDFLASFLSIVSACVLSFVYLKRCKDDETVQPEPREAVIRVEKSFIPKKNRRRSRKKNKGGATCQSSKLPANENMPQKNDGQAKADTPEEFDKKMRCRKNRNSSTRPLTEFSTNQRSVKIYTPLEVFVKLQLDPLELYTRLFPYVLYGEQLFQYGFPVSDFGQPGYVFLKGTTLPPVPQGGVLGKGNVDSRCCCRCSKTFSVSDDGLYQADSTCHYHSGKRQSIGESGGLGAFSCCGMFLDTDGCKFNKHHVSAHGVLNNVKYVKTRDKWQSGASFKVYALDCEMCYTVQGLEVTRISIVGPDGLTVYDSFVLPENPVIDYNTQYSGITASDLKEVKTTLADVQAVLLRILSAKTILIGHGLENDLRALRLVHETVVDTTVVFPHYNGLPYKRSLKSLAASILKQDIQQGSSGHNSVEDARTCIELMLWKVQRDSHLYAEPICPIGFPQYHCQWIRRDPFSPLVPYSAGYWVPPVGSSCDLY